MKKLLPLIAFVLLPGIAAAHTGPGIDHGHGFFAGAMHPLTGLDHALAMISVGLLAAVMGGRARWLLPVAFMAMMVAGGLLGVGGVALPFAEIVIALSVIVFGALLAIGRPLRSSVAVTITAAFAIFHGYAHGLEMPDGSGVAGYALGFVAATGLLHLAGIGSGMLIARYGHPIARVTGAVVALAGVGILGSMLAA